MWAGAGPRVQYTVTPHEYQLEPIATIAEALRRGHAVIDASDTGVGKTVHALFAAKETGTSLGVICPKSVVHRWRETAEEIGVPLKFCINVEKFKRSNFVQSSPKGRVWKWAMPPYGADAVVFDEVHRFGSPTSQNGRMLAACPATAVMLSATAAESPTQMRAIGSKLGLTTWKGWHNWCLANGCRLGNFGGLEYVGGPGGMSELHRQIFDEGMGCRVRKADVVGFPKERISTTSVGVSNTRVLDKAYMEELQAKELDAENALTAQIHASQISEHLMLPAVIELMQNSLTEGNVPVVFCNFRESIVQIQNAFPDAAVIQGGQVGDFRKNEVERLRNRTAPVAAVMIQAGGTGLDGLQDEVGDAVREGFIFPGWHAKDLIQALGRLPRANTKSFVQQWLLYAADTLGSRKRKKMNVKIKNIETLNDGDLAL